jgi:hypothetical protein
VKSRIATLSLLLALAAPAIAANYKFTIPNDPKAPPKALDEGDFNILVNGRAIAREHFAWAYHRDSLLVESEFVQQLGPTDTLLKHVNLVVRAFDYDIQAYQSVLYRGGAQQVVRGVTRGDTVVTAFREGNLGGEGMTYTHPGGRLFVLEPMSFTLLDVIARHYGGRDFTTWPVNLFTLAGRDSILQGEVRFLGTETLKWGARPVVARKLALSDGKTTFHLYVAPQGWLLRAEGVGTGLVVERAAKPVKRAASPPPKGSSAQPAASDSDKK